MGQRNVKDANFVKTFALPAAASSSTTSAILDLGTNTYLPEAIEVSLSIPALSSTIVPDTRTVTLIVEVSTSSTLATVSQTVLSEVLTGAGGAGVAATEKRVRLPAGCPRYIRAKVTFGTLTTDGSANSATFALLF
jgi:hypothetical protein